MTAEQQERLARWYMTLAAAVALATRDAGDGSLARFMREQARLPQIGDEIPPWSYRGWLLPYVMDLVPGVQNTPGRWAFWFEAITTGRLPSAGIPPLHLHEPRERDPAYRNLDRLCRHLHQTSSSALTPMLEFLAWGLAVANEPPPLATDAAEHLYRTLSLDGWIERPADYLGLLLTEWGSRSSRKASGFFPTPTNVVRMMTQMTLCPGSEPPDPWMTVMDPCVGTGRFLLAASNWSLGLYGQDINRLCVLATLINGAVYAPWLSFPLPRPSGREHERPAMLPDAEGGNVQLDLFAPELDAGA